MFIAIYAETIMDVYDQSLELGLEARDILNPALNQQVTQTASARMRSKGARKGGSSTHMELD